MEYIIRPIEPADLELVVAMIREFAVFEDLVDQCEITVERLSSAMFSELAMVEGLIAFAAQDAVGYALFVPTFSSFRGQRGLYLEDLYVSEAHRGKGIGHALLQRIAALASERGFERIDFLVLDDNEPAHAFYRSLGAACNADERHFKFVDDAFRRLAS
ncbi:MAG: GNAT family N-acetyltransferase [Pyrinomonadaceae bacterium]